MDSLTEKYRRTLLDNPIGREVLADLLSTCHFGVPLNSENPHQVAEHGVGVYILYRCGVFAEGTLEDVIRALASVVPNKPG